LKRGRTDGIVSFAPGTAVPTVWGPGSPPARRRGSFRAMPGGVWEGRHMGKNCRFDAAMRDRLENVA
jgi:hypothetical protein